MGQGNLVEQLNFSHSQSYASGSNSLVEEESSRKYSFVLTACGSWQEESFYINITLPTGVY